jgi:transcriptional regulator with XRE-family HTH domain
MSQRKSSAQLADARAFGRRLRELRGAKSQGELAELSGLTRSAIANYELGRSLPGQDVVAKLASALGIGPEEFRAEPTVEDWEEQFKAMGPTDSVSDDEMAFVRLLRCAPPEDAIVFVKRLIDYFEAADDAFQFVDSEQAARDLARLYRAYSGKSFKHGMTADSVRKVARFLAGKAD